MSQKKGAKGGLGRVPKKEPEYKLNRPLIHLTRRRTPYELQMERIRRMQEVSP
jgi:hypothetical protein